MKMTSPLFSFRAWGSIHPDAISKVYGLEGSGVFRRESSYTQLEKCYSPSNPQTSAQQANRALLGSATGAWQGLNAAEKASWNHYQDYRRRRPVMSGYNLYIKMFMLTGGNPKIPPE